MKGAKKEVRVVVQDPKTKLKEIGERLKTLRRARGYQNSDDFAYDHEINRSQYGKYEAGAKDMRISSLLKIINALGVTIEEFFRGNLDKQGKPQL